VDIWLSRCNKTVTCSHCGEDIEVGEPEVFGKLWLRFSQDGEAKARTWTKTFHWHGRRKRDGQCCWLVQALEKFDSTKFIESRGRKKLLMPKEARDGRLKILRKHAKVLQQLRAIMEEPAGDRDMVAITRLGGRLQKLRIDIEKFGGAPESWG
jgi:hypothetical protein